MFHGTYIGNERMLIKTTWGMRLIASCSDMSLMPTLLVDGQIESGLTNWLLLNQEKLKGKNFIDVGANIGYFTVLLACIAGPTGKVVAYEANPRVFELLRENVYLGQLQNQTRLVNKAVASGGLTQVTFHESKKYQGNSSIVPHTDEYRQQFATDEVISYTVPCENLNSYIDEPIELVKIDVEGAELDVLDGMEQLFLTKNVKNVVFELNKSMLGSKVDSLRIQLEVFRKEFGALFYVFDAKGGTHHIKLEEIFEHSYIDNILMRFR